MSIKSLPDDKYITAADERENEVPFDDTGYQPEISCARWMGWLDDAENWAMEMAKELVAVHEGEPKFYENLDPGLIEAWFFEDYPEAKPALENQGTLHSFREKLAHFCVRMAAASSFAQVLLWGFPADTRADVKATFPELQYPRVVDVDSRWFASLPVEVAVLYDRLRRERIRDKFDSSRVAQYSRVNVDRWSAFDLAQVRAADKNTAYVLNSVDWPIGLPNPTHEKVILVISAAPETSSQQLTWLDQSRNVISVAQDGAAEAAASFADDQLVLPLARHEDFFRRLRSRLPVLYVFEDHVLLVEYKWNLIEAGPHAFEEARNEDAKLAVGEVLSVKRHLPPASHHRIERLPPLPRASTDRARDEDGSWDEYGMPKGPF
jgi:hypothetical protein